jgi:hypothetical protein
MGLVFLGWKGQARFYNRRNETFNIRLYFNIEERFTCLDCLKKYLMEVGAKLVS